jgi:hypothetical protein
MKASELEYGRTYKYREYHSSDVRVMFLFAKGDRYRFVSVMGTPPEVCSSRFWLSKKQVEDLIV